MKGFPGVYASTGGFTATICYENNKYHLGIYKTPERAHIVVKLTKHWLKTGFKVNELPRLWKPKIAEIPKYLPLENYKIQEVIRTKGEKQLSPDDLVNLVTELQSLRIFKYGKAKALRF